MYFGEITLLFALWGLSLAINPEEDKNVKLLTLDLTNRNRLGLCTVKTKEYNDLEYTYYTPRKSNLNKLVEGETPIFQSDSAKLSEVIVITENKEPKLVSVSCVFETTTKYYEKRISKWRPIDHGTYEAKSADIRSRRVVISTFSLNLANKTDSARVRVKQLDFHDYTVCTYTPRCGHHAKDILLGKRPIWRSDDDKKCVEALAYFKNGILRAVQLFIADLKTEEILYLEVKGELSIPVSDVKFSQLIVDMQNETRKTRYTLDISKVDRTTFETASYILDGVKYIVYEPKLKLLEAIVDDGKDIWEVSHNQERCYRIITYGGDEQVLMSLSILHENLGATESRYYHKYENVWKPADEEVFYTKLEDLKRQVSFRYNLRKRSSYLAITPKMCIIALGIVLLFKIR